jgi:DNA-binding NtrC family response regulator
MIDDSVSEILLGGSTAIGRVRSLIRRLGPTELPVLIEGPTGAGKELVARAIHHVSGRSGRLVAFNVCAIADTMLEDALFGHVRGAFTSAMNDTTGYLEEADKGTVFLDEIGGLPIGPQAKLLRVVETREFRPVGARKDKRSDFRVVAATNEPMAKLLEERRIRADLAHRLSAVLIRVPSLRERLDDVPVLARHFLRSAAAASGQESILSSDAVHALQQYDWPGNVRELKNVVERAAALCEEPLLTAAALAEAIRPMDVGVPPRDKAEFHQAELLDLLRRYRWDTDKVARELGIARTTVYRRMRRLGIRTRTWNGDVREVGV